jgi:hypothetical protein
MLVLRHVVKCRTLITSYTYRVFRKSSISLCYVDTWIWNTRQTDTRNALTGFPWVLRNPNKNCSQRSSRTYLSCQFRRLQICMYNKLTRDSLYEHVQLMLIAAVWGEEGAAGSADRGPIAAQETRHHDPTRASRPGGWHGTRQGRPEQVPDLPAAVGQTLVRRRRKTPANPTKVSCVYGNAKMRAGTDALTWEDGTRTTF